MNMEAEKTETAAYESILDGSAIVKSNHRLTWRGYCAVTILAASRKEAIALALAHKPAHIPPGTELHYGIVGSTASAVKGAI